MSHHGREVQRRHMVDAKFARWTTEIQLGCIPVEEKLYIALVFPAKGSPARALQNRGLCRSHASRTERSVSHGYAVD